MQYILALVFFACLVQICASSRPPVIVFVGAPFSGKGTQADILSARLSIPILQSGDLFRTEVKSGSELGQKMAEYMNSGRLIPDEFTIDLITKTLSSSSYAAGVIMDGYPRNLAHLEIFLGILGNIDMAIDAIIYLEANQDLLLSRVENRRTCQNCGRPISIVSPQAEACCDNPSLIQRADDTIEKFHKRYEIFQNETLEMIEKLSVDYPDKFIRIGSEILASANKEQVAELIFSNVKSLL